MFLTGTIVALLLLGSQLSYLTVREHVVERDNSKVVFFDEDRFFRNAGGLLIHYHNFNLTVTSPKAVFLFVHGYCEHSQYYDVAAVRVHKELNAAVYGIDQAGHGLSEGERGYVENFDKLANDVLFLVHRLKRRHPGIPFFLYGHSMGGAVSIVAAHRDTLIAREHNNSKPMIDATYLEAPFVRLHPVSGGAPWQRFVAKYVLAHLPKLKLPGAKLDRKRITRSEELMKRWKSDEVIVNTETAIGTGCSFMEAEDYIASINVTFPFFIAMGDDDMVCDHESGIHFFNTAKSTNKKMLVYPNHMHTLKYESPQVITDMVEWFREQLDKSKKQ